MKTQYETRFLMFRNETSSKGGGAFQCSPPQYSGGNVRPPKRGSLLDKKSRQFLSSLKSRVKSTQSRLKSPQVDPKSPKVDQNGSPSRSKIETFCGLVLEKTILRIIYEKPYRNKVLDILKSSKIDQIIVFFCMLFLSYLSSRLFLS